MYTIDNYNKYMKMINGIELPKMDNTCAPHILYRWKYYVILVNRIISQMGNRLVPQSPLVYYIVCLFVLLFHISVYNFKMFQYCRDLIHRHRKKIVVSTGIVAVSYVIGSYVTKKITEFQEKLKEENATRELIKKRFRQTQKDCYMTFLSFLPVLVEPIYSELNVEEITRELRIERAKRSKSGSIDNKSELLTVHSDDLVSSSGDAKNTNDNNKSKGKSKTQLWKELKIQSLTRFFTLIYSESLLIIMLHLQLNIISRKSYLKTALKLASQSQGIELIDFDDEEYNILDDKDLSEQAFLSFSWWLLNKGWIQLKLIVQECVEDVFQELNLREELNIEEFARLISEVQKNIDEKLLIEKSLGELYGGKEDDELKNEKYPTLIGLILPPSSLEFFLLQETNSIEFLSNFNSKVENNENLKKILSELKNYLKSDQVSVITSLLSSIAISKTLDNTSLSLANKLKASKDEQASTDKFKLALILAVLSTQMNELTSRRVDNQILYEMNNIEALDDLSASVYSNFDA